MIPITDTFRSISAEFGGISVKFPSIGNILQEVSPVKDPKLDANTTTLKNPRLNTSLDDDAHVTSFSCDRLIRGCSNLQGLIATISETIKGAKGHMRKCPEPTRQLIEMATLIKQTKFLQNKDVKRHIIETVKEVGNVLHILSEVSRGRYRGMVDYKAHQREIMAAFKNLERRKNDLLSCCNMLQVS